MSSLGSGSWGVTPSLQRDDSSGSVFHNSFPELLGNSDDALAGYFRSTPSGKTQASTPLSDRTNSGGYDAVDRWVNALFCPDDQLTTLPREEEQQEQPGISTAVNPLLDPHNMCPWLGGPESTTVEVYTHGTARNSTPARPLPFLRGNPDDADSFLYLFFDSLASPQQNQQRRQSQHSKPSSTVAAPNGVVKRKKTGWEGLNTETKQVESVSFPKDTRKRGFSTFSSYKFPTEPTESISQDISNDGYGAQSKDGAPQNPHSILVNGARDDKRAGGAAENAPSVRFL
ncbi:hypothetical protein DQ04_00741060 [Trypanosoma grayi]|uniref:hypothetical protein n=1 Tax=Trypanosoma grayi TaxID=71804 RepID=UPI0004F48E26|nr:hypothetical protein DQ04_00741060 [Trypanosoma grayi]KEG13862.1 hypothetical protein DQ04_00741060 [Trypanosoma grayi]